MNKEIIHTSVFVAMPGGGNPCPVVLDADDLTVEQGLAIASKFGTEAVLVGEPKRSSAELNYRVFVPRHEMEMCVHATIAATTVLRKLNRISQSPVRVGTLLGPINVEWEEIDAEITVTVDQFLPQYSDHNPTTDEIVEVLRITKSDIANQTTPIESVSTSRFKLIVPLRSMEVLNHLEPDFDALWSLCDLYNTTGIYVFTPVESEIKMSYSARHFPNRTGYNEDPATGVAACALGSYLTRHEAPDEGWQSFTILQGYAMGKPSCLEARILVENGIITRTQVRGKAEIEL